MINDPDAPITVNSPGTVAGVILGYPPLDDRPTMDLRWNDGILEQRFEVDRQSADPGWSSVWREVPNVEEPPHQAPVAVHGLKTWPQFYEQVESGRKTFELRKDDRGFMVGDILWLRSFDPELNDFTGQSVRTPITYILKGGQFGLDASYVILGFEPIKP